MMSLASRKDHTTEFLLVLLKEERQKRLEAENEVELLRTVLAPLQQKEMDRIITERAKAVNKMEEKKNNHPPSMNDAASKEGAVERELGTYIRQKYPETHGRLVCDCDCDDHHTTAGYDEPDRN